MKLKSYDQNASLRLGTSFSAGYDVASTEEITIYPNTRKLINTGLKLSYCPIHTYIRIAPRSGLSCKYIDVGAGVVDSDYRGFIKVLLINNSKLDYKVNIGDYIAQLIPTRVSTCGVFLDNILLKCENERFDGGFGSTEK